MFLSFFFVQFQRLQHLRVVFRTLRIVQHSHAHLVFVIGWDFYMSCSKFFMNTYDIVHVTSRSVALYEPPYLVSPHPGIGEWNSKCNMPCQEIKWHCHFLYFCSSVTAVASKNCLKLINAIGNSYKLNKPKTQHKPTIFNCRSVSTWKDGHVLSLNVR